MKENEKNYFAIAGFVLMFIEPVIGLVFSILGLMKSKHLNDRGKVLSIISICIFGVGLLFDCLFDALFYALFDSLWFFL